MSSNEKELNSNHATIAGLQALKSNPAFTYLCEHIEHWKNQCLNIILEQKDSDAEKGEFKAYGRMLNAPDFFIDMLRTNPGVDPQDELDPSPRTKEKNK